MKDQLFDNGKYPVMNAGMEYFGRYNMYNCEPGAITLSARGENAGFVMYHDEQFWAGGLCYPYRSKDTTICLDKWLYYCCKWKQGYIMDNLVSHGAIPALNKGDLEKIKIPIPSIAVQHEIVSILDKLHAYMYDLESGLAGEIALRRKQYEYCRDLVLDFRQKKREAV